MEITTSIDDLVAIVRRLLGPGGCPWDQAQTPESLGPFLLEEAYEVLDAIAERDPAHLTDELGDLLFHVVLQAELIRASIAQVIGAISDKLVRRHPHVFGDGAPTDAQQVVLRWERIKNEERGDAGTPSSPVPRSMPALMQAQRLGHRAARVGFDWPDAASVRHKVLEELGELDAAVVAGDPRQTAHELGDLLFAIVNWARKLDIDAEEQLRAMNGRFVARFAHVTDELERRGKTPGESTLEEMEQLWQEAKTLER